MADEQHPMDEVQQSSTDPQLEARNGDVRVTPGRLICAAGLLIGVTICFFVGRRIYYRLIQPEPPWKQPTSKNEVVITLPSMEVALWADETLVRNPTSISVDGRGRLWVTEAVNYRGWNHEDDREDRKWHKDGDRVVILEDSNGDGQADKSTVFAQDKELIAPTGICVLGKRVFVSCSPNIFVFYDDDGDDRADRREVFLTGFGGKDHDHGVHSIVPGPDGRLYLTAGNAGPHAVSDADGWTMRAGSQYQPVTGTAADNPRTTLNTGGLVSDDGKIYVGGLALSIKPDGTDLRVHAHNARNPYELCVDSFGNIWQLDNDDTASCRMTWLMDGSNQGFASADGQRTWQTDRRPGQTASQAHWHQNDPGVLPAGEVYGTGAPTGMVRYEGDDFGDSLRGTILACDAGLGCVFGFRPIPEGAGFRFEKEKLVWSRPRSNDGSGREDGLTSTWFRPVDVAIAPDGSFFVADWYDSYVGAHRANDLNAAGRIYRVRPLQSGASSSESVSDSDKGLAALLKSAAPEIRAVAHQQLLQNAEDALPTATSLLADESSFIRARAQWLLGAMANRNDEARERLRTTLDSDSEQTRAAAARALLRSAESLAELSSLMIQDESASVRREFVLALRDRPLDETREPLIRIATSINVNDPWEIEAFGLACEGHENAIFSELWLRFGGQSNPEAWWKKFGIVAWRLHPVLALGNFEQRLQNDSLSDKEIRRTLDAVGFTGDQSAARIVDRFINTMSAAGSNSVSEDLREYAEWWSLRLKENSKKKSNSGGTTRLPPLNVRYQKTKPVQIDSARVQSIAELDGDAVRGGLLFFSEKIACGKCHRFRGRGGEIGPDLTFIWRRFDRSALTVSILYPSAAILTGYESWTVLDQRGRMHTGLLVSASSEVVLNSADGKTIRTPRTEVDELIRQGQSLMPDSLTTKLQPQQIADLLSFLTAKNKADRQPQDR